MHIIRHRKGHRINLSDNEFKALVCLVEGGQERFSNADVDTYAADETEKVQRLIEVMVWTIAPLAITEDKRKG